MTAAPFWVVECNTCAATIGPLPGPLLDSRRAARQVGWTHTGLAEDTCPACTERAEAGATTSIYPFHRRYPGLDDLFHTKCSDHPDWGVCATRGEAETAVRDHLRLSHRRAS